MGGCNIEKYKLISALLIIELCILNRVACICKVLKAYTFYNPSIPDIKTRYYSFSKSQLYLLRIADTAYFRLNFSS